MNRILTIAAVLLTTVLVGCSDKGLAPTDVKRDATQVPVVYVGAESVEDVLNSLDSLSKIAGFPAFDESQKDAMIDGLKSHQRQQAPSQALAASYSAYASHLERGSNDYDLYLEYKWYAGSRQSYTMETTSWTLYWAAQVCYGGKIANRTWMEGGYQRVTAIVGNCIHTPFGDAYIRSYLRVRTF